MKKLFTLLFWFILFFSSSIYAGEWHETYEPLPAGEVIASMATFNNDFSRVYAVSTNGNIYKSFNGGDRWEQLPLSYPQLSDIIVFFDGQDNVIMVVGDNGVIAKSIDDGYNWAIPTSYPDSANITTIEYSPNYGHILIGSDEGEFYYSYDNGDNWQYDSNFDGVKIEDISRYDDYTHYLLGTKNDSSFIYAIDNAEGYYSWVVDTIPDEKLHTLYIPLDPDGISNNLALLAGNDLSLNGRVYQINLSGGWFRIGNIYTPGIEVSDVGVYSNFSSINILWVTTTEGTIWESSDFGTTWSEVYRHMSGQPITSLITNLSGNPNFGQAVAAGLDYTLKYSFEMEYITPNKGDQLSYPISDIQMRFSSVPDLPSVENAIHATSNYSGKLIFNANYDIADPNLVRLDLQRVAPYGAIPGEKWTINLADTIRQFNDDLIPPSIHPFTIQTEIMPFTSGRMNFVEDEKLDTLKTTVTNYVTGFFNDDDILDLITLDGTNINIFEFDGSGQVVNLNQISYPAIISSTIKNQLLTTDLNNDGRLDLIFYNDNVVYGILNTSSGSDFAFNPAASYSSFSILDVKVIDANRNTHPDLVVLSADSLIIREDIDEINMGTFSNVIESYPPIEHFDVGDLDLDGNQDIVGVASDGLYFYRSIWNSSAFDPPLFFSSAQQPYQDILLADLDLDKRLDIITVGSNEIEIWQMDEFNQSNITRRTDVFPAQGNPAPILDVIVHDFGGVEISTDERLMDIAIITADSSIKFFENFSTQIRDMNFRERDDKRIDFVNTNPNRLLFWDSHRSARLDILAYNTYAGYFQNFMNDSWDPQITSTSIESDGVHISWDAFPGELGGFKQYLLHRR